MKSTQKLLVKWRSIDESFEATDSKPSPFEPINFVQKNLTPCFTAEEYVDYINRYHIQGIHEYDEYYRMPGYYAHAKIIEGQVWVTFQPEKVAGYWVSLASRSTSREG